MSVYELYMEEEPYEPTPYLKRILKQSEKDIKAGYVSPAFKTSEESEAWLNDPNARYVNGRQVRKGTRKP